MTTDIILNEGRFTSEEIQAFEQKYMSVMQNLADMAIQKKRIEDAEKKIKGQLEAVMDQYGIKSLDNQYLKITRVAGTADAVTIDLAKLEKEEPELYEELLGDYPKTVKGKKGSIRFTTKK